MLSALVLCSVAISCSHEDENLLALEEGQETIFDSESSVGQFADDLKTVFKDVSVMRSGEKVTLSSSQMTLLQNSAIQMLKDEDMYTKEISKLAKRNDGSIIFLGVLYLGFLDGDNSQARMLQTRAESQTCYSVEKLQSCIQTCVGSALGLEVIKGILNSCITGVNCITKVLVKKILTKVAGSIISGGVALTVELTACVLGCMNIY